MNKGTWDIIHAQYITSAVRADQYPTPPLIEAAFIGRSNVCLLYTSPSPRD